MSEYQYYEFQAIDRPLTARQIAEVRRTSSRATITSRMFVNEYHWGDFRGNPARLVEKYYDAFLYLANWGTHELSLRLPRARLDLATAKLYAPGGTAKARAKGDHVILDLVSDDETPDYEHAGEGRLAELVPVRAEITRGDHRALYLAWLLEVQQGELDDGAPEPPCPPGLAELSPALEALAEFLRIEPRLIAVAAERSGRASPDPSPKATASEIAAWPVRRKDALLARLARGEDAALVQEEVIGQLSKARRVTAKASSPSRTAGELREAAQLGVA